MTKKEKNGLIERVIENWLTSTSEYEFEYPFRLLLVNLEIGRADEFVTAPGVGLPGTYIDKRIKPIEVNKQEQVPLVRVPGRSVALPHLHSIYGFSYGVDLKKCFIV